MRVSLPADPLRDVEKEENVSLYVSSALAYFNSGALGSRDGAMKRRWKGRLGTWYAVVRMRRCGGFEDEGGYVCLVLCMGDVPSSQ